MNLKTLKERKETKRMNESENSILQNLTVYTSSDQIVIVNADGLRELIRNYVKYQEREYSDNDVKQLEELYLKSLHKIKDILQYHGV